MKKWKYHFGFLLCVIIVIFSFYAQNSISASETKASFVYDETKNTLLIGEKYRIKVVGKNLKVKWKSSDKSVATVSKNGSIIGKKQGTVQIKGLIQALLPNCYGCVALVFQFSDKLFGKKNLFKEFNDFTNIENEINPGDIIRLNGNSHSVMVIEKDEEGVTLVEGNYNDAVHWDRHISYGELKQIGNYYLTRYPR